MIEATASSSRNLRRGTPRGPSFLTGDVVFSWTVIFRDVVRHGITP
jgi:hypothetical protein